MTMHPTSSIELATPKDNVKYILYSCDVLDDGIGDAQHLVDFFAFHRKIRAFQAFQPLMLMTCSKERKNIILKMLEFKNLLSIL